MKPLLILLIAFAIPALLSAQAPNDSCTNAQVIANIDIRQSISIDLSNANESLDASCEDANNINLDLWYSFTMPFNGQIRVTGLSFVNKTSLYESCGGQELACQSGSGFFTNLQGGNTYLLRYATASQFSGNNTLFIQAFPIPGNDECGNAIPISNISSKQTIQIDNRGASESLKISCDPANLDNFDLWYSFTMPYDGNVKVSGTSASQKMGLFDSCGSLELACLSSSGYFLDLSGGLTYYIRFGTTSSSSGNASLTIQAFAPPVNDTCSHAIGLGDISRPYTLSLDNRGASESLDASCERASAENLDLWYDFVMPFDGNVKVTGVFGVNKISLFDGCGGNELACTASAAFWEDLDAGGVYLVRYSSIRSQAINDQINIQAVATASNDECTSPIVLDSLEKGVTVALDTRSATESLDASCETASANNVDLWYEFTMPFWGNVKISGVFGVNKVSLYDSCGGNELACTASGAFFENLTAGQRYLLRYAAISQQANVDQFSVQAVPTGLNDDCVDAFLIPDIETQQSISLDTRAASESLDASCETENDDNLDLWYTFVMPFDGLLKVSGVFGVNKIALYDACGGNELSCFGSNGVIYNLEAGQEYLLRYAAIRQMANVDEFFIQAFRNLDHDLCENAIQIDRPDSAQVIVADTREASQSVVTSCEDSTFSQQDLWYRFTMPFEGKLLISEGNNAHNFSLWDSCGGNEISCFSGFGAFNDLSDNTEYWLRYASPFGNAILDSFEVQAVMSVGVEDIEGISLKLYPNPVKDRLVVEWEGSAGKEAVLSVLNFSGQKMLNQKIIMASLGEVKVEFLMSDYPKGLYFLQLEMEGKVFATKIIME